MQTTLQNPTAPATKKQLWLLHILTKQDTRGWNLTMQQASDKINQLKGNSNSNNHNGAKLIIPRPIHYGAKQRLHALEHLPPMLEKQTYFKGHNYTVKLWERFEKHGYQGDYTVYSLYVYKEGEAKLYATTKDKQKALATVSKLTQ